MDHKLGQNGPKIEQKLTENRLDNMLIKNRMIVDRKQTKNGLKKRAKMDV